ncbi:hypothetical protein PM082_024810 [Marasmius tenuissimus]|nr:hypothetical protein PM082_024810 [Marasmius tenuissimus]
MNKDVLFEARVQLACRVLYSCLTPVMGIASTLIIVRSALGIAIKDETTYKATVLGEGDEKEGGQGTVESVINIRRCSESTVNSEERYPGVFRGIEKWKNLIE